MRLKNQLVALERRTGRSARIPSTTVPALTMMANAGAGALVEVLPRGVQLTYSAMVVRLFERFGDQWRDHLGRDDGSAKGPEVSLPVQPVGAPVMRDPTGGAQREMPGVRKGLRDSRAALALHDVRKRGTACASQASNRPTTRDFRVGIESKLRWAMGAGRLGKASFRKADFIGTWEYNQVDG